MAHSAGRSAICAPRCRLLSRNGCARGGQLQWNPESPYWLDVEEFERGVRRATPAMLHEATSLYIDDLLPGIDADWVVLERERLRQIQRDALRELAAHHRALAEYATARNIAEQLVAMDPLSGSAQRELIALHALSGDRAAALAAYRVLCTTLETELGVAGRSHA